MEILIMYFGIRREFERDCDYAEFKKILKIDKEAKIR